MVTIIAVQLDYSRGTSIEIGPNVTLMYGICRPKPTGCSVAESVDDQTKGNCKNRMLEHETLYSKWISAQLAKGRDTREIDIMDISECRWTEHDEFKLTIGDSVTLSRREDRLHQHGVMLVMRKKTE